LRTQAFWDTQVDGARGDTGLQVWPGCKDALDHDRTVGRPEHDFLRTTTTGCPLKKIDVSAQTGDGGIALIHQQVNKMGFVWHERKTDAGIDGEIELRNPVTGEVANRFILIQSKASAAQLGVTSSIVGSGRRACRRRGGG
jgi:hypothetical protein